MLFLLAPLTSVQAQTGVSNQAQLVAAINDANASVINISANITLTAALPAITRSLTINGNNNTIDANSVARIFNVTSGGNLTINNLTMTNGRPLPARVEAGFRSTRPRLKSTTA